MQSFWSATGRKRIDKEKMPFIEIGGKLPFNFKPSAVNQQRSEVMTTNVNNRRNQKKVQ